MSIASAFEAFVGGVDPLRSNTALCPSDSGFDKA